ncbi:MAG: ATP-binding protein [Hyphomicrobiaceae bacterium]
MQRRPTEGIHSGIEQLKDLEWSLGESESRYRHLLDTQIEIITRVDGAGRLTFVNRAFCRTFGVEPSDVLGNRFTFDIIERDPSSDMTPPETGRRVRREKLVKTVDGPRWFAFEFQATYDGDGHLSEIQSIGRDVTDLRRSLESLAKARDQAEAANLAKSRFLAAMSHEIRTPMNGILGMTGLLADTPLSAEQKTYVDAVQQSTKNLLTIVDEVLDMAKIEAGRLEIHPAPFELDICVQGVVELLSARAGEKNLDLAWRIEPGLPRMVEGDETRVRQVLTNLIGNAVKFTDSGGVAVRVSRSRAPDPADQGAPRAEHAIHVDFEITDTGSGIPRHLLPKLFSEFEQVDKAVSRKRNGTGLGLAISRRLAIAMGGDITVETSEGRGSTFTARIALATSARSSPVMTGSRASGVRRVLLVGASRLRRQVMKEVLASLDIAAETANPDDVTGVLAAETSRGHPFDTLVADAEIGLPGLKDLIRTVRSSASDDLRVIIVCEPSDRKHFGAYRAVGCDAYLMRPVRPSSLVSQVERPPGQAKLATAEKSEPRSGGTGPRDGDEPQQGADILLVEDNAINALLAVRMCELAGCKVVHTERGELALKRCATQLQDNGRVPDIILMDIHMPGMDGLETTRRLKALFAEAGRPCPPIVALTANAFAEDRKRCFDAGLDDYRTKPFDRSELETLLEKWCPGKGRGRDGLLGDYPE